VEITVPHSGSGLRGRPGVAREKFAGLFRNNFTDYKSGVSAEIKAAAQV